MSQFLSGNTVILNMNSFLFSEGTELQRNPGILPERILCWHNCSHCVYPAGQCYQASKEGEGTEDRVRKYTLK